MSYNITGIKVLKLDASMRAGDVVKLLESGPDLPGSNFLDDLDRPARLACAEGRPDEEMSLKGFSWQGDGSRNSFHGVLLPRIAPLIRGTLEAVLIWEGGDLSGLRIVDGVATEHEVTYALGAET